MGDLQDRYHPFLPDVIPRPDPVFAHPLSVLARITRSPRASQRQSKLCSETSVYNRIARDEDFWFCDIEYMCVN